MSASTIDYNLKAQILFIITFEKLTFSRFSNSVLENQNRYTSNFHFPTKIVIIKEFLALA